MTDLLERLKASLSDRYEIDSEIGRGGMAVVFLALDRKLDRKVALKVLRPELASSLGPERFLREIEIAAGLTHPNILTLYDCGDAEGLLYYVMPYVDGESLRDRLSREKQLPIDEALAITREVADAIGYAHAQDIVHRDIKPANIMFSAGHAIVADFGIARAVTEAGGETLTQTGLAVGTPAYMSPEQATGESDIDSRSDLYSLGCVLFEMLTGEIPYAAATPQSLIAKKLHEPTPRVSVLRASVPASVEDSLQRLLANAPADRFRSAAELAEALGVRNGASERAFPERASTPLWRSPLTLVAALAVITVGFWAMLRSSAASGPSVESITVLPVQAAAGDSSSEAYATALTLSINSALGRIEGIVVKGHHSHSYLDPDLTDAEITRELGVDALLRTELLMQGGRVTVHSSLYDGDASMLWSGEYDHDLADLQNLAREVARDIASGIEIDLTTRDEALLAARDSVSPEALEEYLWGQLFWRKRALRTGHRPGLDLRRRVGRSRGRAQPSRLLPVSAAEPGLSKRKESSAAGSDPGSAECPGAHCPRGFLRLVRPGSRRRCSGVRSGDGVRPRVVDRLCLDLPDPRHPRPIGRGHCIVSAGHSRRSVLSYRTRGIRMAGLGNRRLGDGRREIPDGPGSDAGFRARQTDVRSGPHGAGEIRGSRVSVAVGAC
jgi:serine/threonine protein kinase